MHQNTKAWLPKHQSLYVKSYLAMNTILILYYISYQTRLWLNQYLSDPGNICIHGNTDHWCLFIGDGNGTFFQQHKLKSVHTHSHTHTSINDEKQHAHTQRKTQTPASPLSISAVSIHHRAQMSPTNKLKNHLYNTYLVKLNSLFAKNKRSKNKNINI